MGFDLELDGSSQRDESVFRQALARNLVAQRFAIDAYREIAAHSGTHGRASFRLAKVALAVEEEHAEILSSLIQRFGGLSGAAG